MKLCVDGPAFGETSTMAAAFMEDYPGIRVEVELLPQLRLDYDENYMPVIDTDSQAQRKAALQQHRTALMAGSADADLYLITGGTSQFLEMNGGTLVQDPYDLMTAGVLADLSALTTEITAYAFAPATASDQEAAQVFLSWLLSEQSQNGSIPVFSNLGGGYPVRKGCAGALFANSQSNTGSLEYIGEGYPTSLNEMENRVTHGKFTTAYDYELLNLLSAWHAGVVSDLDAALEELYGDWALYLDE